MKVSTDRIRRIVLSLRNFSRVDEADFKAVDIHEGLDSTLMILQHRLKETCDRPAIQVNRDYGAIPPVKCYPGQLNQVFMNILANAIDALDEAYPHCTDWECSGYRSEINIQTTAIDENWVRITIADSGVGMPETIQRQIFDPFFTTKPIGKGTGMGMPISYRIITERHSGSLKCTSTPGQGTAFIIEIPIQQSVPAFQSKLNE